MILEHMLLALENTHEYVPHIILIPMRVFRWIQRWLGSFMVFTYLSQALARVVKQLGDSTRSFSKAPSAWRDQPLLRGRMRG